MDQFPTATIDIADTAVRQIEWNAASKTITGTIQWTGQTAKAITGAIAYRDTLNGRYFYTWAYSVADRPVAAAVGVISLVDGTTSVSIPVTFVDPLAAFKADAELGTATGGMVANAAQVLNVPRAAAPVTPGAPQAKHLENSLGATLQSVREVLDGDA